MVRIVGNHPQMAQRFRLVKYSHLPRFWLLQASVSGIFCVWHSHYNLQGGAPKIAKLVYNYNFTRTYGRDISS